MITALEKNPVDIITHLTYSRFTYIEEVINFAIKKDILLELNNSKVLKDKNKGLENYKKMVDAVRDSGKKLIVNSDAHFTSEIGDFSAIEKNYYKLGLSKDIIINNYPGELKEKLTKFP